MATTARGPATGLRPCIDLAKVVSTHARARRGGIAAHQQPVDEMKGPSRVRFTAHARLRLDRRGLDFAHAERLILEMHERRTRNRGQADWRLVDGDVVILYDWPVEADETLALVRSAWRR